MDICRAPRKACKVECFYTNEWQTLETVYESTKKVYNFQIQDLHMSMSK